LVFGGQREREFSSGNFHFVTLNVRFTVQTAFMQWSAVLTQIFGGQRSQALQLLSGLLGLAGVMYGLQVLMVERANIPVCSADLLTAVGEQSFLRQQQLTVEVAGAVVEPGVWQVAVGSRMADAIEKAGGLSQRADRTFAVQSLNLAQALTDGQKIYVPFAGERLAESSLSTGYSSLGDKSSAVDSSQTASQLANLISVNGATAKELQTLPGVGEVRASKIMENRPYVALSELVTKEALTEGIFTNLQGLISL
jgi:competence protein ComEA